MKFHLEADPAELPGKVGPLLDGLASRLWAFPDTADMLHKAANDLSGQERLRYPVALEIAKRLHDSYQRQLMLMGQDIGKVLDQAAESTVLGKSLDPYDQGCAEMPEPGGDWVELPEDVAAIFLIELEKSRGVPKYIRRIFNPAPPPKYRYFYNVTGGSGLGHASEVTAGSRFAFEHNGQAGHYQVNKVEGNQVNVEHTASGHQATMHRDDFTKLLRDHHIGKIRDAIGKVAERRQKMAEAHTKREAKLREMFPEHAGAAQAAPSGAKPATPAPVPQAAPEAKLGATAAPSEAKPAAPGAQAASKPAPVEPPTPAAPPEPVKPTAPAAKLPRAGMHELGGGGYDAIEAVGLTAEDLEQQAAAMPQDRHYAVVPQAKGFALVSRPKAMAGKETLGGKTDVYLKNESGSGLQSLPAQWVVMEADDLVASHNPESFAPRADYPEGVQERRYHEKKGEQLKVDKVARQMTPALVVNTNPDAVNGAPIVTEDGVVLGGNGRTMGMQRSYLQYPENAQRMKEYLASQARQFELSGAHIMAMKHPVLVRRIQAGKDKEQLTRLGRRMNESLTQGLDPRAEEVAISKFVTKDVVGSMVAHMEPDQTLSDFLLKGQSLPFVRDLERAGIIDPTNRDQFVDQDTGLLNEQGRSRVSRVLAARMIPDATMLDNMDQSLRNNIALAVPFMLSAEEKGWDLREPLMLAIKADHEMSAKSYPRDSRGRDAFIRQPALFGDKESVRKKVEQGPAAALLEIIQDQNGPRKLQAGFKQFAMEADAQAHDYGAQGSMFARPKVSQDQALAQAFKLKGGPAPQMQFAASLSGETDLVKAEQEAEQTKLRALHAVNWEADRLVSAASLAARRHGGEIDWQRLANQFEAFVDEQRQHDPDQRPTLREFDREHLVALLQAHGQVRGHGTAEQQLQKAMTGPFIGPRGGKWADAQHTIPWHEGVDYEGIHEEAHAAVRSELPSAIHRAVASGADPKDIKYLGAGAESVVLESGGKAYKVGRHHKPGREHGRNEAAAIEALQDSPVKHLVPKFHAYHPEHDVAVVSKVGGSTGGWGTSGKARESYEKITKELKNREFTHPEYKDNSFIFDESGNPVMVDLGFIHPTGKRSAQDMERRIKAGQTDLVDDAFEVRELYREGAVNDEQAKQLMAGLEQRHGHESMWTQAKHEFDRLLHEKGKSSGEKPTQRKQGAYFDTEANRWRHEPYQDKPGDDEKAKRFHAHVNESWEKMLGARNAVLEHQEAGVHEFKNDSRNDYAVLLPDASKPGNWRYSQYDEHGFSGHQSYPAKHDAMLHMADDGYSIPAKGTLDKMVLTPEWAQGSRTGKVVQTANAIRGKGYYKVAQAVDDFYNRHGASQEAAATIHKRENLDQLYAGKIPEEITKAQGAELAKGASLYIGPQGGKWADPQHTVHWQPWMGAPRGQGLPQVPQQAPAGQPAAQPAPQPPPQAHLPAIQQQHQALPEAEQQKRYFTDRNTGLLNARGMAAQPHDPKRPMTARFSMEGFKAFNDNFGHEIPDGALRMMANALAKHVPDGVKRGGDLEADVRDQAHAERIAKDMARVIDPKGRLRVVATAVPRQDDHEATLQHLGDQHRANKDAEVAAGKLGHRLKMPVAFAGHTNPVESMRPLADAMHSSKARENAKLSEHHATEFKRVGKDRAFQTVHQEATGLLTDDGFARSIEQHPDHHVASADLRGLQAINAAFGREAADTILKEFSELVYRQGGGEVSAAHPHGDEYLAHHQDPEKLRAFFTDLKTASDNTVFFLEKSDGMIVQKGLQFAHGIGKTLDEADRVDLAKNKAAQGEAPKPSTFATQDGIRYIAELRHRGFHVIELGGGVGQGVPGSQGAAGGGGSPASAGSPPAAAPAASTASAAPGQAPRLIKSQPVFILHEPLRKAGGGPYIGPRGGKWAEWAESTGRVAARKRESIRAAFGPGSK